MVELRMPLTGWLRSARRTRAAAVARRGSYARDLSRRLVRSLALAALVGGVSAGAASPAPRVVGGTAVQVQSAPWAVFVTFVSGDMRLQCTGSVIDASHVLTAAHCLYDEAGALAQPSAVSIAAGISNYAAPASTDLEQDRPVASFRVHPGYAFLDTGLPDDVAVLTLAAPLDLSGPAVQAVALPAPNTPFPAGAAVSIAGFGQQISTADPSGQLESMTATVDPQSQCGEYTQLELIQFNNAVLLCLTSPTSTFCNGDSGSGIVTTGGTPVLIAVADAGTAGCPVGTHGISAYVGAPEILSFIQGNDQPPTAPRPSGLTTSYRLTWAQPLVVGDILTCTTKGWPEPVTIVYSFLNTATGEVLQTGPGGSYLLPANAVGSQIVCELAVTDSGGTTLVKTISTSNINPAPQARLQRLAPLTAKRGHDITLHVVLQSPRGLSGKFSVCATLPASVGGHLCRSIHERFGASGNFPFTLIFRIKKTAPLRTVHIAIIATAGTSTVRATALLRITKP